MTEAYKRRIVLPMAGPLAATDHVLGHELTHAFQYNITGTNVSSNTAGALALPLWFIEGMAEYLSIGPVDPHTAMWMRDAARRERLPAIDDLDDPRYFPYRYGHALWAFLSGKYGDKTVGSLLRAGAVARDYREAFQAVLGVDTKELTKLWHEAEFEAYRPVAEATTLAGRISRPVIINAGDKGPKLNVSPELSPDGSRFMFFSERDLFSIDLFLADTATGKVIRKITDTATSAHFESLQFLGSAGAWDPSGVRFVVPAIAKGEPVLAIFNADNGRKEKEIRIEGVDEVLNPTWSQDGNKIAFSGLVGGLNDLFVYDLAASSLQRLTSDPFAEMDPAFSPDGTQIAFATDRFTTKLDVLAIGQPRIAIIDLAGGAVRNVGGFEGAKNIGPQWTRDGRGLFFLSDRDGITNVYRLAVAGGEPVQLTNLVTGVSGITELSPAMSAAGGKVIFSAYEDDGYNVYALETETQLTGTAPVELPGNPAVLPPRTVAEGPVALALLNPTTALPPAETKVEEENYKPKLSLDFVGQPSIGVGAGPFGAYVAGGVSFLFSDMLGNHTVGVSAQATSRFDEFGGSIFYMNKSHRWNYGVGLDQTPYVSRGYQSGIVQHSVRRRLRRERVPDPADGPFAVRRPVLPVQPGGPRRVQRRGAPDRPEAGCAFAHLLADHRGADRRTGRGPGIVRRSESRPGGGGAGLRHVDLRRDQPDPRQPLPARVLAERRFARLQRCAGGRTGLPHAEAPGDLRAARPLLRALRQRRGRPAAADAVSWIPRPGPRLRFGFVRGGGVRHPAGRLVPGVRPLDRQQDGARELRGAGAGVGASGSRQFLRSAAGGAGALR